MEDRRTALVALGRGAWPKIAIDDASFFAHLARHDALETAHASDLFLACAAGLQDRAALAYFEEHFMAKVPGYVLRVRIGRDVVDEVQQKLRETLLMGERKIAEYSGQGALGGWLRVAAVRTALNQVRGASPVRELHEDAALVADPELAYVKEHARQLFADAFKRVIADLAPGERAILRLHYLEGLTMDQLAKVYRTPRSTIARRVGEARTAILEATASLLQTERRLSPSAAASVIREAQSRLDVTMTRLLT